MSQNHQPPSISTDLRDITMADDDTRSKFFIRPPPTKKTAKNKKTPAKTIPTKNTKQDVHFKKDTEDKPNNEKEKTTPMQERRILKELLNEQSKDNVEAINNMAKAMIDKMQ